MKITRFLTFLLIPACLWMSTSATVSHANGYAATVISTANALSQTLQHITKTASDTILAISQRAKQSIKLNNQPAQLTQAGLQFAAQAAQAGSQKRTQDVTVALSPIQSALARLEDIACVIEQGLNDLNEVLSNSNKRLSRKLNKGLNKIENDVGEGVQNLTSLLSNTRARFDSRIKSASRAVTNILEEGYNNAANDAIGTSKDIVKNFQSGWGEWSQDLISGGRAITAIQADAVQDLSNNAGNTINGLVDAHLKA